MRVSLSDGDLHHSSNGTSPPWPRQASVRRWATPPPEPSLLPAGSHAANQPAPSAVPGKCADMAGGREMSRSIFMSEQLRDLNGIERGALEQLVAADPEGNPIFHRAIAAEAAGEAVVLPGTVERHGISVLHELESGRIFESCASLLE